MKTAFLILLITFSVQLYAVRVSNLRCEYLSNPLGIDNVKPQLSWQLNSDQTDDKQSAYQVIVSSNPENLEKGIGDCWNTGRIKTGQSVQIQYTGKPLTSMQKYYWKVRVYDKNGTATAWSEPAWWIMGILDNSQWKARWITGDNTPGRAMPLFKKDFKIKQGFKNARIFVSGLGYNEVYVNGTKAGDHVLDPAQSNYNSYALYSTYDVTGNIKVGLNRIGVMLGDGWYNQNKAFGVDFSYGKPVLICQLKIEYANGETELVASDTTWQCTEGPVISANVYAGEVYDARKEIINWCTPGETNANWQPAGLAANYPPALKSQMLPPIKKMKELTPKSFFRAKDGKYIFDLGQNFAGWVKIKVTEPSGTAITMRMSEELYPDKTLDFTSTGVFATQFTQTDTYICKGEGTEQWEPRFTYHGFRYVEVSGLSAEPDLETIKGIVVYSSMDNVGTFSCSDDQINQLHTLAMWTLTSNLHGFPSDCPHREKCGWLGDAHAIAKMTIYNLDMEAFWIKYLNDIRSSSGSQGVMLHHKAKNSEFYQAYKKAGIPFMISPGKRECGVASPDWGTALVQIPWYLYLYYGNKAIIEDFYPDMKLWTNYIDSLSVDNIVPYGLGDWCPPGGNATIDCPYQLSSTAYHLYDLQLMEQMSKVLGYSRDNEYFNKRHAVVKKAFIAKFYDPANKTFGSQTANSLALDFGLAPQGDEKAVSSAIAVDVAKNYSGFHHTGIFGLPRIFDALARYGNEASAGNILTGKGKLSFENMWKVYGATTLWEELPVEENPDGAYKGDKFGSHSHPMQGGFDAWFYQGIAGINPVIEKPGFKAIRFEPFLTQQLKWAEATLNSKYGLIKSSWKWQDNTFLWEIIVPANSEGMVILPFTDFTALKLNDRIIPSNQITTNAITGKKEMNLSSGKFRLELK
jgi:alpha-L-rhamnosidase